MARARRHQRLFSGLAFGLLALAAELVGRSLTNHLNIGRHVGAPSYVGAAYYPFLLAAVKIGIALLLARLAWRFARAHAAARAGRRLLSHVGARHSRQLPRVRLSLSPRLWLASFTVTAVFYLVQMDAEALSAGGVPLLDPWLHTSALPVFAVLAVVVAFVWGVVAGWLADYERYAEATVARAYRAAAGATLHLDHRVADSRNAPRKLFGLSFESRPPPAPA
ncbi:MAG TPA: hypothetical protein VNT04_09995 [Gaiellaceae bacterium]|jgi:hypothetical protein|nr:hypothetical protein [Gaiellaceae bacterium]